MLAGLPTLGTTAVLYAFQTSDAVGKGIVVLLFFISIYAWILMIEKFILVRRLRQQMEEFLERFRTSVSALDLVPILDRFAGPQAVIFHAGMNALIECLGLDPQGVEQCCRRRLLPRSLSETDLESIRKAMERKVEEQVNRLDQRLPVLGTVISVSPLLGLLGTVWGIMVAFCSLAEKGRADIGALAPGVSGALLTTVAGLVVAIPAAVGYNALVTKVGRMTEIMEDFRDELLEELRYHERER